MFFGSEPLAEVISLNLPEDTKCKHPAQIGGCFCAVRTGGDRLAGTFTIRLHSNRRQVADVCFEGVCRTWLPETETRLLNAYEHRFLLQVQCIDARSQSTESTTTWPVTRTIPFEFQIPRTIPEVMTGNISGQDQSNHDLYPSTKIGRTYFDPANAKLFAQPFINYTLSVRVRSNITPTPSRHCISRSIKVMPTAAELPPIDLTAFKGEYQSVARANIRNHFYSHSIGYLECSADQPQTIRLPEQYSQSQTTVFLKISFQQISTGIKLKKIPYDWKFEVCSRLRRRVFCATNPLTCTPIVANASRNSNIGLRTDTLSVEKKRYECLTWRNNHISPHGTILPSDDKAPSWITTIPIKITAASSLLPSFSGATSSLRYSISLHIRVVGARSSCLSLAVPVQIISPARKTSQLDVDDGGVPGMGSEDISGGDLSAAQEMSPPEYRRSLFQI